MITPEISWLKGSDQPLVQRTGMIGNARRAAYGIGRQTVTPPPAEQVPPTSPEPLVVTGERPSMQEFVVPSAPPLSPELQGIETRFAQIASSYGVSAVSTVDMSQVASWNLDQNPEAYRLPIGFSLDAEQRARVDEQFREFAGHLDTLSPPLLYAEIVSGNTLERDER